MINHSKSFVKSELDDKMKNDPNFTLKIMGDTIVGVSQYENQPFETIFLFKDSLCYFQQTRIYCSPCADKMVNQILNDRNYKFVAIDAVNYISQKDTSIVLRLSQPKSDGVSCNEIMALNKN